MTYSSRRLRILHPVGVPSATLAAAVGAFGGRTNDLRRGVAANGSRQEEAAREKKMARHLSPAALREFWEARPDQDKLLKLRGEEIGSLEELLAIQAREPRQVDRELAAQNRAAHRRHNRRGKEIDAELKVKEREVLRPAYSWNGCTASA